MVFWGNTSCRLNPGSNAGNLNGTNGPPGETAMSTAWVAWPKYVITEYSPTHPASATGGNRPPTIRGSPGFAANAIRTTRCVFCAAPLLEGPLHATAGSAALKYGSTTGPVSYQLPHLLT